VFAITSNLYGKVDTLLVGAMSGLSAAGVYGATYRFVTAIVGLSTFLSASSAKELVGESGSARARTVLMRQFAGLGGLAAVAALPVLPVLCRLTTAVWPSLAMTTPIALAILPAVLTVFFTQTSVLLGSGGRLARASVLTLVLALILYPALIHYEGVVGAGVASLLVEAMACVSFARVYLGHGANRGSRPWINARRWRRDSGDTSAPQTSEGGSEGIAEPCASVGKR
jgi:O-antigen/teichoic acid export membrane protein